MTDESAPLHVAVAALKERIYVSFTGLAIVLAIYGSAHPTATNAVWTLAMGVLGVALAALASDVIAHLAIHRAFPDGAEFAVMVRIVLGALASAVIPMGLLIASVAGALEVTTALLIASYVYVAALGLIGWLAVRNAQLSVGQKLVALVMLVAVVTGVLGIQVLAHSH